MPLAKGILALKLISYCVLKMELFVKIMGLLFDLLLSARVTSRMKKNILWLIQDKDWLQNL